MRRPAWLSGVWWRVERSCWRGLRRVARRVGWGRGAPHQAAAFATALANKVTPAPLKVAPLAAFAATHVAALAAALATTEVAALAATLAATEVAALAATGLAALATALAATEVAALAAAFALVGRRRRRCRRG